MDNTYQLNTSPAAGVLASWGSVTTGLGTISNGGANSGAITGSSTDFRSQFTVGDFIKAGGETQTVLKIDDNLTMTTTPFVGALSGAGYTLEPAVQTRWQILDNGAVHGPHTVVDTNAQYSPFNIGRQLTLNNGTNQVVNYGASIYPGVNLSGSGRSATFGVYASAKVARTAALAGGAFVAATGVTGAAAVAANNSQDWPLASNVALTPAGVAAVAVVEEGAEGTISALCGALSSADASAAPDATITKMFGHAVVKVAASTSPTNVTNGVGTGIYAVDGTNSAYVMLSDTALAVPTGNWAIYDDTGLDTRLSGAVKIGAGSDLVIDSDAILHQYGVALPKNNNTATAEPTASDDSTADYSIGSIWFWPATGRSWRLADATASAAVWVENALAEQPAYVSNHWYLGPDMSVAAGTPPTADAMQFAPLLLKARVTLSTLGVRITTSETGGNLQLALYANDPATGRPTGDAVATTAGISTSSTGTVSAAIAGGSVTLEPGMYWASFNLDTAAGGNVAVQVPAPDNHPTASLVGSASQANLGSSGADNLVSLYVSQSYGTWPDVTSATFVEGSTASRNGPAIHFKVA